LNNFIIPILSFEIHLSFFSKQQHQDFVDAINQIMPYGKYKGYRMHALPGHYLAWFHRQGFPDNKLGRQMALVFELDHNALMPLFKKYFIND